MASKALICCIFWDGRGKIPPFSPVETAIIVGWRKGIQVDSVIETSNCKLRRVCQGIDIIVDLYVLLLLTANYTKYIPGIGGKIVFL
jgi:hypothetical protein